VINLTGRPFGSGGLFRYIHKDRTIIGIRAVLDYIDTNGGGKGGYTLSL